MGRGGTTFGTHRQQRVGVWTGRGLGRPAAAAGLLVALGAAAAVIAEWGHLAVIDPRVDASVEAITALAKLFGALVLFISPSTGNRRCWLACALLVLGLGGLIFGYLVLLVWGSPDHNIPVYAWMATNTLAAGLLVAGLVPRQPRSLPWRAIFLVLASYGVLCPASTRKYGG